MDESVSDAVTDCARGTRARTFKSQIVHVVSMLEVPMMFGSASFQSKDVSGAHVSWLRFFMRRGHQAA